MRKTQQINRPSSIFQSAKTGAGIPHAGGLVHDALVQNTLAPEVRKIGYIGTATAGAREIDVAAITITRDDGRYHLDIVPARALRSIEDDRLANQALCALDLMSIEVTAADIMMEPQFSSARAVWTYRRCAVSLEMRLKIQAALAEEGPLSLHHLCTLVQGPQDPFSCVLALACADVLEIDLIPEPIGPRTMIRSLRAGNSSALVWPKSSKKLSRTPMPDQSHLAGRAGRSLSGPL